MTPQAKKAIDRLNQIIDDYINIFDSDKKEIKEIEQSLEILKKKPIWEIKAMVKALSQPISSFLNTDEDNKRLENCKIILNQPTRK